MIGIKSHLPSLGYETPVNCPRLICHPLLLVPPPDELSPLPELARSASSSFIHSFIGGSACVISSQRSSSYSTSVTVTSHHFLFFSAFNWPEQLFPNTLHSTKAFSCSPAVGHYSGTRNMSLDLQVHVRKHKYATGQLFLLCFTVFLLLECQIRGQM